MDGSGALFSEFIAALPAGMDAVVVSYPPDQPMGYEQLEALAYAKLPSRPFILVGESFSGPIAVALAAAAPVALRGVVLVGSFVRTPAEPPRRLRAFLAKLPVWRLPMRLAAALLFGRWSSQPMRCHLAAALSAVAPATWRARLRAVLYVDVADKLRSIRTPLLYLRGTSDRLVPRSAWDLIGKLLPTARLVELEGPHALLQTRPVESAAQVTAFAKEVGVVLSPAQSER
jgi:pimeloyl-[acyl-carrier protein] methyl ester esterase